MKNYRKELLAYFEFGIFENAQKKNDFNNGLLKIESNHISFFENKSIGKNKLVNYIAPNTDKGKQCLGLMFESELTYKLKSDLFELWNLTFNIDSK
jgi:hypothetical protein